MLLAGLLTVSPIWTALAQNAPAQRVAEAQEQDLRVFVTAAVREPLNAVLEGAAKASGKPVVVEFGSARGNLRNAIMGGQDFEVAILLPDVNRALLESGKVKPGSYRIAVVPVGLGVRGDVPNPDVSSPEAIKAALLGAKSVKYSPTGAALDTVKKILGDLAVSNVIRDDSRTRDLVDLSAGEYEMNIYPISEIIANPKLRNLGPVIPPLQVPVVIEATIGTHARHPKAALKFIRYLQGPSINASLRSAGMVKDTRDSK
jgi:molybdate transport system substrate-binding protein